MAHTKSHRFSFWNEAFGLNVNNSQELQNILGKNNTNLSASASQKEVLLWHQQLSHASICWVQMLMRKRDWLTSEGGESLHNGPFIWTRSSAPTCDISRLKCGACLCAKAKVKRPQHMPPRPSMERGYLKANDVYPGSCISADHIFHLCKGVSSTRLGVSAMAILAAVFLWIMQAGRYSTSRNSQLMQQRH